MIVYLKLRQKSLWSPSNDDIDESIIIIIILLLLIIIVIIIIIIIIIITIIIIIIIINDWTLTEALLTLLVTFLRWTPYVGAVSDLWWGLGLSPSLWALSSSWDIGWFGLHLYKALSTSSRSRSRESVSIQGGRLDSEQKRNYANFAFLY